MCSATWRPKKPDADETVGLVEVEGRKAIRCPGDIRSEETCQKIIDTAVEQQRGLPDGPNAPGQEPKSPMKEAVCQGVDFQPGDGVNRVAATSLTMWCH